MISGLVGNFLESFIDNVLRDNVRPKIGSILYCDLAFGNAEHSGVYIGNKTIVHLDGSGKIEAVDPSTFMRRLGGFNSAMSIYVSCRESSAVGCSKVAARAKSMIGNQRNYSMLTDNCHQFTSGCLTGNFENSDNFLWMLKRTVEAELQANSWRVWETQNTNFVYSE